MGHIRIQGISKAYKRYAAKWGRLAEWLGAGPKHELKWVLQDISFHIAPGEAIGIIGENGAGKSTLLKIITGTTRATTGTVEVGGRISALLELGMGFHPDFTGRQNVYTAGQLKGLSKEQLDIEMPGIEAFAEIGDYIDQPVRTYSSGMQVRLAFSVATAIRPDILIVDEALAVGDIFFQQKCYDRIKDYVEEGTTLLFVSHSMNTIIHLCDRTVLLKAGRIAFDGASKSAIDLYRAYQIVHRDIANKTPEAQKPVLDTNCTMSDIHSNEACRDVEIVHRLGSVATRAVYLKKIWLEDEKKSTKESVISGSVISICMTFMINHTIQDPNVGFDIRNKYGLVIFESNSHCMNESIEKLEVKQKITARFQVRLNLFPDDYTISVGFANGGYKNIKSRIALLYLPNVLAFTVIHDLDAPRWCGVVNLAPKFHYAISA